jgi:hypothetical protein
MQKGEYSVAKLLGMQWLILLLISPAFLHAQISQTYDKYYGGARVWYMSGGPYNAGDFTLIFAYNQCRTKLHEDCFFWTPLGCDGVTENPVFSNYQSRQQLLFCVVDPFGKPACYWHIYCTATCTAQCDIIGPEKPDPTDCPIVIPMGADRQVHFTDLTRGVLFDLDADGNQERISWTDPRSTTVFLALDRDGDGAVTDGSELFGNHTLQPPSTEPNGFNALAVFDTGPEGGNGDGVISELDAVFANLWLWHDENHDGQSQPAELWSLPQSGLSEIDLHYHENQRRDQFGNLLRYQTKVTLFGGQRKAVDVFFLRE